MSRKVLVLATLVLIAFPALAQNPICIADLDWIDKPTLPKDVPNEGSKSQNLCDFHQFAYQSFLYLISRTKDPSQTLPNFLVQSDYPFYHKGKNNCQPPQQTSGSQPMLIATVRTRKPTSPPDVDPDENEQAGKAGIPRVTIYDQAGKNVYYMVQFNQELCRATASGNLPVGTTEIKTSWRDVSSLSQADQSRYFTVDATVNESPIIHRTLTLGLVGFHLVRNTAAHPEFIWATFEHRDNAPNCDGSQRPPGTAWSFTSTKCAEDCIRNKNCFGCTFNTPTSVHTPTSTPTEICRVFPDGTKDGTTPDNQASVNKDDISDLNTQIRFFLSRQKPELAVFENYIFVGSLWENNPNMDSSDVSNQRGSIRLANTTMETVSQGNWADTTPDNCFSCHNYFPGKTAEPPSISHIFADLKKVVPRGPLTSLEFLNEELGQLRARYRGTSIRLREKVERLRENEEIWVLLGDEIRGLVDADRVLRELLKEVSLSHILTKLNIFIKFNSGLPEDDTVPSVRGLLTSLEVLNDEELGQLRARHRGTPIRLREKVERLREHEETWVLLGDEILGLVDADRELRELLERVLELRL